MDKKNFLRKKYFFLRKKNYFNIEKNFFNPLIKIIQKSNFNKKIKIGIYYPNFYELNILKILDVDYFKKFKICLPIINEKNLMNFYEWKDKEILILNKYGIPEPFKSKITIPSVLLIPLLAFDKNKNRLGYGKGFYDRYLYKTQKKNKKILSIGVAFSFQKHNKLPFNKRDYQLDCIITEKGLIE